MDGRQEGGSEGVIVLVVIATALLIMLVCFAVFEHNSESKNLPHPSLAHHIVHLSPATVIIKAGGTETWRIQVDPRLRNFTIAGRYEVSGGGGNDLICVLTDSEDYENWANGHAYRAYYSSPGQVTTGSFRVVLPPGDYTLAFSNKFSVVSQKLLNQNITESFDAPR